MEGNPFAVLAASMSGGGSGIGWRRGTVISEAPLQLEVCGTVISGVFEKNAELRELRAGDETVLLTEDDQSFFILCRVVKV